jgi:transposase-like protein
MTHRRRFTAEFKVHVVLDLVNGAKSAAELCRHHQLNPQLPARWKTKLVERAPFVIEQEQACWRSEPILLSLGNGTET